MYLPKPTDLIRPLLSVTNPPDLVNMGQVDGDVIDPRWITNLWSVINSWGYHAGPFAPDPDRSISHDIETVTGCTDPKARIVSIRPGMPEARTFHTLAHESGHVWHSRFEDECVILNTAPTAGAYLLGCELYAEVWNTGIKLALNLPTKISGEYLSMYASRIPSEIAILILQDAATRAAKDLPAIVNRIGGGL